MNRYAMLKETLARAFLTTLVQFSHGASGRCEAIFAEGGQPQVVATKQAPYAPALFLRVFDARPWHHAHTLAVNRTSNARRHQRGATPDARQRSFYDELSLPPTNRCIYTTTAPAASATGICRQVATSATKSPNFQLDQRRSAEPHQQPAHAESSRNIDPPTGPPIR
jgi:hypothetical protein